MNIVFSPVVYTPQHPKNKTSKQGIKVIALICIK